jgi:hypothetical protein
MSAPVDEADVRDARSFADMPERLSIFIASGEIRMFRQAYSKMGNLFALASI